MPKTAPIDTAEAAYEAAIKMLTRKSRTCQEVRETLLAKAAFLSWIFRARTVSV